MKPDFEIIKKAMWCKCPSCFVGALYKGPWSLTLCDKCESCGLDYSKNDSGDGPAVFLIFILGALLVPLAIAVEFIFEPPAWFHAVFWAVLAIFMTIAVMRPLKAYIMALQFKHRPGEWL